MKRQKRHNNSAILKASKRLVIVIVTCIIIKNLPELSLTSISEKLSSIIEPLSLFILKSEAGYLPLYEKDKLPELILSHELNIRSLKSDGKSEKSPDTNETHSDDFSGNSSAGDTASPDISPSGDGVKNNSSLSNDTKNDVNTEETTITGENSDIYDISSEGLYYKNGTDYDIDLSSLLASPVSINVDDGAEVLIIHTHGSEAYMPDGEDIYTPTDPYRTIDKEQNVINVGDELERVLSERGITVIHDREFYDYPQYNGAYSRSLDAINSYLENNPNIKAVIDLHRDALEDADGTVYKTIADIGDTPCAQVMLIVGTDFSGLSHDGWRDNLSFAVHLQSAMVNKYPTLARPINISKYRYNQHATKGSLIVEVGCNGNTLKEAVTAIGYFGDCLADVLGA